MERPSFVSVPGMALYLVQHGKSKSEAEDPERPLTEEGRADVGRLAAVLGRVGVRVARIQHSGKRRASETAEILAGALRPPGGIVARSGLAPNDAVAPLAAELESLAEDVMLVGHLPHLGRLVSRLLAGREEPALVALTPGTLARLEHAAGWSLAWLLPPSVVGPG